MYTGLTSHFIDPFAALMQCRVTAQHFAALQPQLDENIKSELYHRHVHRLRTCSDAVSCQILQLQKQQLTSSWYAPYDVSLLGIKGQRWSESLTEAQS